MSRKNGHGPRARIVLSLLHLTGLSIFGVLDLGCEEQPPPEECRVPVPIVEPAAFRIVPEAEDPFERDAGVPDTGTATTSTSSTTRGRCGADATMVEDLGSFVTYSIVTRECSRLTVEAPLLVEIPTGTQIELRIWHYPLLPYGPAEATLRVELDGAPVWSRVVDIPSQSELVVETFTVPERVQVGGVLRWHVSNHGVNSWNWVSATFLRAEPCLVDASSGSSS